MKIQLLSDLHLEFEDYRYQPTNADVLVQGYRNLSMRDRATM